MQKYHAQVHYKETCEGQKMKRKEMTTISFVINMFKFTAAPVMENVICSETRRNGQHTVLQAWAILLIDMSTYCYTYLQVSLAGI